MQETVDCALVVTEIPVRTIIRYKVKMSLVITQNIANIDCKCTSKYMQAY